MPPGEAARGILGKSLARKSSQSGVHGARSGLHTREEQDWEDAVPSSPGLLQQYSAASGHDPCQPHGPHTGSKAQASEPAQAVRLSQLLGIFPLPQDREAPAAAGADAHDPEAEKSEAEEDSDSASECDAGATSSEIPPGVPTRGSLGHGTGTCRPCFYVRSTKGCRYGLECVFCHVDHEVPKKEIPGKSKRVRYRTLAERWFQEYISSGTIFADAEAATQQRPEFPSNDRVSANYVLKLLRHMYKYAGHNTRAGHSQEAADGAATVCGAGRRTGAAPRKAARLE